MSNVPNRAPNVITAAGAVTATALNHINAASALALTLAAPTIDGVEAWFTDETGHAHTITTPATVINGATHIATFNGTAGSCIGFVGRNGVWMVRENIGVTLS